MNVTESRGTGPSLVGDCLWYAEREELSELLGRYRAAEIVALCFVALMGLQEF